MAITINVKTLAVSGWDRGNPMARNCFGDATPGYIRGHVKPNYPVPAIRYNLEYDQGFLTGRVNHLWQWAGQRLVNHWNNQ